MNISNFFIKRPIFAAVISIIIFVIGALAYFRLPLSEYPEVVPPTVVVRTSYPGANPTVIADTVASPLEQQINGVEGMLYMFSQATADGVMTLTITFGLGTDLDKAQVQVQNRVSQALPRLPQEVGLVAGKYAGAANDGGRITQHHCARRQGWADHAHPRSRPRRTRFQHVCTPKFAGQQAGGRSSDFAAARFERTRDFATGARHDGTSQEIISGGGGLQNRLRSDGFRARIDSGCRAHVCRSADPSRDWGVGLPPNVEGVDHSSLGAPRLAGRNVFDHAGAGFFA